MQLKFKKDLYPKVVLLKAAYNFTDIAYLHLDADEDYYYVAITPKDGHAEITAGEFENEILAQSVRHATTVLAEKEITDEAPEIPETQYSEEDILKDWFADQ